MIRLAAGLVAFALGNATILTLMAYFIPSDRWAVGQILPSIAQALTWCAHWIFMSYLAVLAVTHAIVFSERARAEALTQERLRSAAVEAQLTALAKEMQPHFLFNALNALVSMLGERPEAQQFTIRLHDMLRVLLRSSRVTATVGEELDLVDAYLAVERARLGTRLRTDFKIDEAAKYCRLPALMLQPLVENAVTHGISRMAQGGEIRLRARIGAARVVIEIDNSRPQLTVEMPANGSNLTIPNSRKRLELMYGEAAALEVDATDPASYRTIISIPLDPAESLFTERSR